MRIAEATLNMHISFPWTCTFHSLQDCNQLQQRLALSMKSQALRQLVTSSASMRRVPELLSCALDGDDIGVYYTRFEEHSPQERKKLRKEQDAKEGLGQYKGKYDWLIWGSVETTFVIYSRSGVVFELKSEFVPSFTFDHGTPSDFHLSLDAPGIEDMAGGENYENYLIGCRAVNSFHQYLHAYAEANVDDCDGPDGLLKFVIEFLTPIFKGEADQLRAMFQYESECQYSNDPIYTFNPPRHGFAGVEHAEALYNLIAWVAQPGTDPIGAS